MLDELVKVADPAWPRVQEWIDDVLAEHPDEARRFLAGERKLQGVLVGLVMKKSSNSADPKQVSQLLSARIGT